MDFDNYDDYEEYSHYFVPDRQAHRASSALRKPALKRRPAIALPEVVEQLDREDRFVTTLGLGENEQVLLQESLGDFFHDQIISDVLARVKGGKEANVYCCQAHPNTGMELIAAKIYRPEAHRTMRNDAIYKEGRLMLDEEGKGIVRAARVKRAIAKKTDFGREIITFSWIEHEYDMMQMLHAAGADVPRPVAHVGNTILMEYLGDVNRPAPTLSSVQVDPMQARSMFDRLIWHVELMLSRNRVHGDLSAYNVLLWEDRAVVIDFPQAVVALNNPYAFRLLQRDLDRLCQYFVRYGVVADGKALATNMWTSFITAEL